VEILGVVLALVGLAFAFQRPRDWFLGIFRKKPDVEYKLGTRA
jgi:hypothetical protein